MNTLSTDVLIIGSGAAGLRAAIEARRQGASVLLISKSKTGLANCTASAMGAFTVSREEKDIAKHIQQTLTAGRHLNNPKLVQTLATKAWPAIKELEKFGINLLFEKVKANIITERPPAGTALAKALSNYAIDRSAGPSQKIPTPFPSKFPARPFRPNCLATCLTKALYPTP